MKNNIINFIDKNIAPIICYTIALMILFAIMLMHQKGFINLYI
jgi:hypothetical protein